MVFCVPEDFGEPGSCGGCSTERMRSVETRVSVYPVATVRPGNQLSRERDRENKTKQKTFKADDKDSQNKKREK